MNRLKDLRAIRGLTQNDLADLLHVTRKAISFYELGQRDIPNDSLLILAKHFNVSTDFILGRYTEEEQRLIDEAARQIVKSNMPRFATGLLGDLGSKVNALPQDDPKRDTINQIINMDAETAKDASKYVKYLYDSQEKTMGEKQ